MSKRNPYEFQPRPSDSPIAWTTPEDLAAALENSQELQAKLEQEFPAGTAEWTDPVSRRTFLTLMGASVSLATLAGCRRPVENIMPYSRLPEHVIPGIPSHYATVIDRRGESLGLVVESHEGRPTKIEGNPDHPASNPFTGTAEDALRHGGTDLLAQSSVLDLYDPDRARKPTENGTEKTLEEFDHALAQVLAAHQSDNGTKLRVLALPTISPTFIRLRNAVKARFSQAKFHTYESVHTSNIREGSKLAFGRAYTIRYAFDRAKVILSLDSDFLQTEPGMVRHTRLFAESRRVHNASTAEMSRLYVVEPGFTTTGTNADHRLRLPARDVEAYLHALAAKLVADHGIQLGELGQAIQGATAPTGVTALWLDAVARDLAENKGRSVIVVGARQPATVHALAHELNIALENLAGRDGKPTVELRDTVADQDEVDQTADLRELATALEQNQVDTLIILGGNPVYNAPADLNFGAKLRQARNRIHVASHRDETSEACTWHVPLSHYLEAWGDHVSAYGGRSVQQPLIAPLHSSRSEIEILAALAGESDTSGYAQVRRTILGEHATGRGAERRWAAILHEGYVTETAQLVNQGTQRPGTPAANLGELLRNRRTAIGSARALGSSNLEVAFAVDPKLYDGRFANNPWLQEQPDPVSKLVWDNAALVSPSTAEALGVRKGDMIRLSANNRSVEIAVYVLPGHADNSITVHLGWGRKKAGRVGTQEQQPTGNVFSPHEAHGGFDVHPLRSSEAMGFMDGVRAEKSSQTYHFVLTQDQPTMARRPIAIEKSLDEYKAEPHFAGRMSPTPRTLPLWREVRYDGHKWGLSIDLNVCTGCNACALACQAENNVPVVSKAQVYRGREMFWLRVDRYFTGEDMNNPGVMQQPVMCVHCEEAPCENVCPVNATSHGPEGLNDIAYNRCIGTRYCSNNCPYKVRRFNYLNWHNDGVWQPQDSDVPETLRMQHNPNVTVRFRGVIEKCSYCVQRIQSVKIAAKREDRAIRDGEIQTACQQACPAGAIVFGDLNQRDSRIATLVREDRNYKLLGEIGTQPRTTYLAKIRNPNTAMTGATTSSSAHGQGQQPHRESHE